MSEAVELDGRDTKRFHESFIVAAICARFNRFTVVGDNIESAVNHFHKRFDERECFHTQWYLTDGVGSLWVVDYQFGVLLFSFNDIDALDCSLHLQRTSLSVDVFPSEGTDFTDTEAGGETKIDAQSLERKIGLYVVEDFLVVGYCQYFYVSRGCVGGIFDVPLGMFHPLVLNSVLHYHLQHNENVFDGLDTQSGIEFFKHKCLNG